MVGFGKVRCFYQKEHVVFAKKEQKKKDYFTKEIRQEEYPLACSRRFFVTHFFLYFFLAIALFWWGVKACLHDFGWSHFLILGVRILVRMVLEESHRNGSWIFLFEINRGWGGV